jgi:hypothetical protein
VMEKDVTLTPHTGSKQDAPAAILVYGRDAELLETRRWVLERAGMKVITVTDLAQAENILLNEAIDLFILCHTLSPEEGDLCLMKAQILRPEMKKLVLTANTPLGSLGPHEPKVSAFGGPKSLLFEVEKILGTLSNRRALA